MWQHGEDKREQFHAYVNSIHPNINLTLTSSATNIPYLDVFVSFDGTNMHTSIYTISTDGHGYLHHKSFHPIHIKKSMLYSQFIRYKRICPDKFTFEYQASNIFQHFINRDYPRKLIYNEFRNVCHIDRNNLLKNTHRAILTLQKMHQKEKFFKIPHIIAYVNVHDT